MGGGGGSGAGGGWSSREHAHAHMPCRRAPPRGAELGFWNWEEVRSYRVTVRACAARGQVQAAEEVDEACDTKLSIQTSSSKEGKTTAGSFCFCLFLLKYQRTHSVACFLGLNREWTRLRVCTCVRGLATSVAATCHHAALRQYHRLHSIPCDHSRSQTEKRHYHDPTHPLER